MNSKTYSITGLTEDQAKELAQLLNLAVKAERLSAVVGALLDAPNTVATKANEFAARIKEESQTETSDD